MATIRDISKTKNSQGFAVVEGLLILVIVGLIAGIGWYVWNAKKQTDKTLDSTGNSSLNKVSKKQSTQNDETANWLIYKSPDNFYTIKLPDGWALRQNGQASGQLETFDNNLAIKVGTTAKVEVSEPGGRDYSTGFIVFEVNSSSSNFNDYLNPRGDKQDPLLTNNGLAVQKYVFKQTQEPEGPDIPNGGTGYTYNLVKGGKLLQFYYAVGPNDVDYHENIEKAIKTVTLS